MFDFFQVGLCYTILVRGCFDMMTSYKKLWKLLIDRDLKKKDLEQMAGVSHYTMNKLTHGDNVTTDVICRICKALNVNMEDIVELVEE